MATRVLHLFDAFWARNKKFEWFLDNLLIKWMSFTERWRKWPIVYELIDALQNVVHEVKWRTEIKQTRLCRRAHGIRYIVLTDKIFLNAWFLVGRWLFSPGLILKLVQVFEMKWRNDQLKLLTNLIAMSQLWKNNIVLVNFLDNR